MADGVLGKAIEVLKKYPLCDRCLGRLFGYLGKGLSNAERGRALKIAILLEVHRLLQEKAIDVETARTILHNAQLDSYLAMLGLDKEHKSVQCFVCNNMLDVWIKEFSEKISLKLVELGRPSFVIGVTSAQEYIRREESIVREFDLRYRESIKRELKREIGKNVALLANAKPDFENPEVIIVADLAKNSISVEYPSLILYGYYWKFGRKISQNIWIGRDGSRKYPLAIEDVVKNAAKYINAEGYRIHIAGREDVDVRMIGSGRPIAIEFKVLGKSIDIELIEKILNSFSPWIAFSIKMKVRREFVSRLKTGIASSRKIYRAVVYTSEPVTAEKLSLIEQVFSNKVVEQRTPTRVLRRRKDMLRKRKVYAVKVIPINEHLFEALIDCDGGLYVKELVSGDNGRTNPSFSDVLGCKAKCIILDALYVHEHI